MQSFHEHKPGTGWWCPSTSNLSPLPGEQEHQLGKISCSGRSYTGWNQAPVPRSTQKQKTTNVHQTGRISHSITHVDNVSLAQISCINITQDDIILSSCIKLASAYLHRAISFSYFFTVFSHIEWRLNCTFNTLLKPKYTNAMVRHNIRSIPISLYDSHNGNDRQQQIMLHHFADSLPLTF